MFIKFGWGKNLGKEDLKYEVTDFNVSLSSSDEYAGGLGNCVPGSISLTLEIPANLNEKPAGDIFSFARKQHDDASKNGAGKIVVYEGPETAAPLIQEVEFDQAWISDLSSGVSRHDEKFTLSMSVTAATVKISDVEFKDKRRAELVSSKQSKVSS